MINHLLLPSMYFETPAENPANNGNSIIGCQKAYSNTFNKPVVLRFTNSNFKAMLSLGDFVITIYRVKGYMVSVMPAFT